MRKVGDYRETIGAPRVEREDGAVCERIDPAHVRANLCKALRVWLR